MVMPSGQTRKSHFAIEFARKSEFLSLRTQIKKQTFFIGFNNILNTDFRASFNRHIDIRFFNLIYLNLRLRYTESSQEIDFGILSQGTDLNIGL